MRNQDNWKLYYEKSSKRAPRETLIKALEQFPNNFRGLAFDLGSGACREVKHLLDLNWQVIAVDNEWKAKKYFEDALGNRTNGTFQLTSFENIKWQKADLIHGGFALAFCPKPQINEVLEDIKANLKENGVFSANFFGPEHTWSDLCLLSKAEILAYFKDFEILEVRETKEAKTSTLGEELYHHDITLIAKKLKV